MRDEGMQDGNADFAKWNMRDAGRGLEECKMGMQELQDGNVRNGRWGCRSCRMAMGGMQDENGDFAK